MEPPSSPDDIDEWADALLDRHRDGPRGAARPAPASEQQLRRLTPLSRWMLTRDGRVPDADGVERIIRAGERHQRFAKAEAIVTLVGVVLAFAFMAIWLGSF